MAALFASGRPLRFPPLRAPLACFFLITVAAVLASGHPVAGLPQIRKFFVFSIVLVIYSTFETLRQVRALIAAWVSVAALSGLIGVVQFSHRRQESNTYEFLLDGRITGLASHWMTFGGEQMIVILMLASCVLFSRGRLLKLSGWPILCGLLAVVVLGMTRCVFLLGVPAGLAYLLWRNRPSLLFAAVPVLLAAALLAPPAIRERAISAVQPHGDFDSRAHRALCRLVGWEMVKAHPWLGLGPERIAPQFDRYIPPRLPRPVPRGWYGHLHNIYFQYAAERGVFALIAILWLIARQALDFLRSLRRRPADPGLQAILHAAIAVTIAILAEGFFEYNLGDSEVLTMFLSVVACGYVAIRASFPDSPPDLQGTAPSLAKARVRSRLGRRRYYRTSTG